MILLDNYTIDYNLSNDICIDDLKKYNILPLYKKELYMVLATCDDEQDTTPIATLLNSTIKFEYVSKKEIDFALLHLDFTQQLFNLATKALINNNLNIENSYIDQFLDILFKYIVYKEVSDIHFESLQKDMIIRVRIDGELLQIFRFDKKLYSLISSLIKIYGNLDISQVRLPLNSRFTKELKNDIDITIKSYDFRISTMPTIYGESIVLRVLDNDNIIKNLFQIGFVNHRLETIKRNIRLSQGLVLVTGPTGSGKTTTLYSMLNSLNKKEKKIITIEDPVEYKLEGIMQVNINEDIELDYHTVLKNILRQDPDILMIGEIRDEKSLSIAMQAALTGHLVIATLHTNSAIETITRLKDLKAQSYLISSTLKMILSQRLLKKLCNNCKIPLSKDNFSKAVGCKECNFTGYKDRVVVSEILEIDDTISQMISSNQHILKIKEYIKKNNFSSIKADAKELVNKSITTLNEYYTKVDGELL